MQPLHIVYFNFDYPHSPTTGFTKTELYRGIRDKIFKAPKGPVLFVFPEAVLGMTPIARAEGKALALRVHELLAQRGNAFAFYSTLEKSGTKLNRGSVISAGYLITPRKGKPYLVYPKVSPTDHGKRNMNLSKRQRLEEYLLAIDNKSIDEFHRPKKPIQEFDIQLLDSHARKVSPTEQDSDAILLKWIESWLRRNELTKSFPRIKIGGRHVKYRVCADVGRGPTTEKLSKGKKDLIIVSSHGLELPAMRAEMLSKSTHPGSGAVFMMDGSQKTPIYHARQGEQTSVSSFTHDPKTKIRFERGITRTRKGK